MARRGVGIKEPKGAVKTSIILLLADKPKSTFENIREYLKETYGITNTTGIRNHIKWLVENRLVSEKKRLMGSTGYYGINLHYLKTNFETFKRVFLYLKEMHRENELIETRYYKSYVKSPDFKAKFPVNIFKENTIQLYDYVIKQECLNGLFEQTFGEGKPSANILSKQFIDILFEYDVDEVADRLNELSNDEPLKTLLMRYKNFTDFINTVVVNEKERPQVVEMALISPSVINYILKPTFIDPGLAYTGPLFIMGFHTLDYFTLEYLEEMKLIKLRSPNETGTYTILKSLFISDLVNHNLITTDIPTGQKLVKKRGTKNEPTSDNWIRDNYKS